MFVEVMRDRVYAIQPLDHCSMDLTSHPVFFRITTIAKTMVTLTKTAITVAIAIAIAPAMAKAATVAKVAIMPKAVMVAKVAIMPKAVMVAKTVIVPKAVTVPKVAMVPKPRAPMAAGMAANGMANGITKGNIVFKLNKPTNNAFVQKMPLATPSPRILSLFSPYKYPQTYLL